MQRLSKSCANWVPIQTAYEIHNSVTSNLVERMVEKLYVRLQRRGYLRRDIIRMVNRDRNIFGALLLQMDQADAMITGVTRTVFGYDARAAPRSRPQKGPDTVRDACDGGQKPHGFHFRHHGQRKAKAEELAHIAEQTAMVARRMGHTPRVAFLSFSTFGNPHGNWLDNIRGGRSDARRAQTQFRI